jgi:hypothetical protein
MNRTPRTTGLAVTAATVFVSLTLTGCSGPAPEPVPETSDSPSATQPAAKEGPNGVEAVRASQRHLQQLKSVTITSDVSLADAAGQLRISGTLGDDANYTVQVTADGGKAAMTIIHTGSKVYLTGSPEYFRSAFGNQAEQASTIVGDKYLDMPADLAQTLPDADPSTLIDNIANDTESLDLMKDPQAPGKPTDLDGRTVYAYPGSDGDSALYLTADGTAQLAGMTNPETGRIILTEHNQAPEAQAPSPEQVMTMDEVQERLRG